MGGSVNAIEQEFIQNEIARSAYVHQLEVEKGEKIIVGVNKFQVEKETPIPILRVDDTIRQVQIAKLNTLRNGRDQSACDKILHSLRDKAVSGENLMPTVISAVENHCTLGEIADTLREVFGVY
jgi:methylmalonyl-CoA mutase N-terminal domain/subunit